MQNFKIGFKFLIPTFILALFNGETAKFILRVKNKSIFTLNDTELDTDRFDKKMNYNYITKF